MRRKILIFILCLNSALMNGMGLDKVENKLNQIIDSAYEKFSTEPQDIDSLKELITLLTNRTQQFPQSKFSKELLDTLTKCQQACLMPTPKETGGLRRSFSFYNESQLYPNGTKTWNDNKFYIVVKLAILEACNLPKQVPANPSEN